MIYKNKISSIVRNQLPEYIGLTYEKFVKFIEYYYEFLEQDQQALDVIQNSTNYSDIDLTIDSFLQYFLKNYAEDIPKEFLINEKLLVKNIQSLYESKGTEKSFQLLFKILFNDDITVRYPYKNVLIPSSGIWNQRSSLRLEIISGDSSILTNRQIKYTKNNIEYIFNIESMKVLNNNSYEVFIDSKFNTIPFSLGDYVYIYNSNNSILLQAKIKPTITKYFIISAGMNFKIGQIIFISVGNSTSTLIKINEVNSDGGILSFEFIEYGYGYEDTFNIELKSDLSFAVQSSFLISDASTKEDITFSVILPGLTNPDRYFEEDYAIDVDGLASYTADDYITRDFSSTFTPSSGMSNDLTDDIAVIQFTLGALSVYPGQYVSYSGFLSEPDVRIQDDKLYQPFAYQIQSTIDINDFFTVVKKIVHQSGTRMFNNKLLNNDIDINSSIDIEVY